MSGETEVLDHSSVQEEIQEKNYTINDMARDIANRNPERYGPQGKFPIFKEGKHASELREDINKPNFTRWMRQEISQWYETNEQQKGIAKRQNKLSTLLRRFMPPSRKKLAPLDLATWEGNLDDFEKFIVTSNDGGLTFKRDEYMQATQKKMTKANFELAGPSD